MKPQNIDSLLMMERLKNTLRFFFTTFVCGVFFHPANAEVGASASANYVRKSVMLDRNGQDSLVTCRYYDGLGRLSQTVHGNITPTGADLVVRVVYNAAGLPEQEYLPGLNNGNGSFANTVDYTIPYAGDNAPYTLTQYERTPMHRPIKVTAPGNRWHTSGKGVTSEYLLNSQTDGELQCRIFSVETGTDAGYNWPFTLTAKGYYKSGEIEVVRTTSEDGNVKLSFIDHHNNCILERHIIDGHFADTYRVYDIYDNLRLILPPECSSNLPAGAWSRTTENEELQLWAYCYVYDQRGRMIRKKLPGCPSVEFRYDDGDEPVMWRDGNLKSKNLWRFQLRDSVGRPTVAGLCTGAEIADGERIRTTTDTIATGQNILGNTVIGATLNEVSPLSVRFYDHYSPMKALDADYYARTGRHLGQDVNFMEIPVPGPIPSGELVDMNQRAMGQLTVTAERITVDSVEMDLVTAFYYDSQGRLTDRYTTDHIGGVSHTALTLDFTGHITLQTCEYRLPSGTLIREEINYSYDRAGRMLTADHSLSYNGKTAKLRIADNNYDELGRLSTSNRGSGAALHTTYGYNIRSWPTSKTSLVYSQQLDYSYGGNISRMQWHAGADSTMRSYDFSYDGLDRLVKASYGSGTPMAGNYDTFYRYDLNGNMLELTRHGLHDGARFDVIDDLRFQYSGNRMTDILESANDPTYKEVHNYRAPLVDGDAPSQDGIQYDTNGNVISYKGRFLSASYDSGNQPEVINIDNMNRKYFVYTPSGVKLREKFVRDRQPQPYVTTRDYLGAMTLLDGQPDIWRFDGGYIDLSDMAYYLYTTDHLGNIRTVSSAEGAVVQTNHYYPFGTLMGESSGAEVQRYKFGGKELDREGGLDIYDFEARRFDCMRFLSVDPLSEQEPETSPYVFCRNNPLINFDEHGDSVCVLIQPSGAGGFGHMAILIQHEDGKWHLWSKNGEGKKSVDDKNDLGTEAFDSPEQFINGDRNKPDKSETGKYKEGYVIPTTPEEDATIRTVVSEQVESKYHFLSANCAIAVQKGLKSAGLKSGTRKPDPLKTMIGNKVMRDSPNNIFPRIKKSNSGYSVKRQQRR